MPDPTSYTDVPHLDADRTASVAGPATTAGQDVSATLASRPASAQRYDLGPELARGGMGVVYRATDTVIGREVAVKVLHDRYSPLSAAARRFDDEARITGQLQHPAIPPVHDLGTLADGRPFMAMKLIKGQTLDELLKDRPDATADRGRFLATFEHLCQALAYAHAHNVIHRDLKPANVMVGSFGEVQVMDWGLAKVIATDAGPTPKSHSDTTAVETEIRSLRDSDGSLTQAGSVIGTPAFMAPEQAIGLVSKVDTRSDVFGLGGILAVILTGKPPFVGHSVATVQLLAAQGKLDECFGRLDACGAEPELVALAKRCLNPNPRDRPANAGEVSRAVADLRAAAEDRARVAELDRVKADGERITAEARAAEEAKTRRVAEEKVAEQRKRRRVQAVLGLTFTALIVLGGVAAWWRSEQIRAAHERQARNADAVAVLLERCDEALLANDESNAALALEAAEKRAMEGGAEHLGDRTARCREHLRLLHDLNEANQFRWILIRSEYPKPEAVAARFREALGRFGVNPQQPPAGEAADRVSRSLLRDRLIWALDRCLWVERAPDVLTLLQVVDPDPYRDAVRQAVVSRDAAAVSKLALEPAALSQSAGFTAILGEDLSVPTARRRELLLAAVRQHPKDANLLMAVGQAPRDEQSRVLEAIRWYQTATTIAPNAAAHIYLGLALRDAGDAEGAAHAFREVMRIDPNNKWGCGNLAVILRMQGNRAEEARYIEEYIRLAPQEALARIDLGHARRALKDYDAAIASYREATRIDPKRSDAPYFLGVCLQDASKFDEAERAYREAVRLDGDRHGAAIDALAALLVSRGNLDGAIAVYREILRIDPKNVQYVLKLGDVLKDRGDLAGAIAVYEQALRHDPKAALVLNDLGVVLELSGRIDDAIASYREAIRLAPGYALALRNLGLNLNKKGDTDGAIAAYREALRIEPNNATTAYRLGNVLRSKGALVEAVAAYREAIRHAPHNTDYRCNLGLALVDSGDVFEAITTYREVILFNPRHARAHSLLGLALRRAGDTDGAVAALREATRLDPKFSGYWNNLGWVLGSSRYDQTEALAALQEAIRLNPKDLIAWGNKGYSLTAQGDPRGAIAAFQEVLRLDPKSQNARAGLARAERERDLLGRLPEIVAGTAAPRSPAEGCEFAKLCGKPLVGRFAMAVRLFEAAFAAKPSLMAVHRYDAACFAARAARGDGIDAPADAGECAVLRAKALGWLRADLALREPQATSFSATARRPAADWLAHSLKDTDLAATRPGFLRIGLPDGERNQWDAYWSEVRTALALAQRSTLRCVWDYTRPYLYATLAKTPGRSPPAEAAPPPRVAKP